MICVFVSFFDCNRLKDTCEGEQGGRTKALQAMINEMKKKQ